MGDSISPTGESQETWLPASSPEAAGGVLPTCVLEYRVGLQSLRYLADHGFHDMVVLPGSFHIELVRCIHREIFQRDAVSLRRIVFERPVILTDNIALTVKVESSEGKPVVYTLFEASREDVRDSPGQQPCARMEVELDAPASIGNEAFGPIELNEFVRTARPVEGFYSALRRNGNQYGPQFQVLTDVRRSGSQASGQLSDTATSGGAVLSPPLLDAAPQLLAALALDRGRTFILKSIDRLQLGEIHGARPCQVRAARTNSEETNDATFVGSVQVVDSNGAPLWELSGVTLAFIDRPSSDQADTAQETELCLAATFTAEPLEESLQFWAGHFGRKLRIEFAPYNQVFQQLLDPASAFRRNRSGIDLLVLDLEDWLPEHRHSLTSPEPAQAAAAFGSRARTVLPNGLEIAHLNRYETDYVFQEIFEDQSYLRHDIQLDDQDTVIDIGANIGLFSLFVMSRCENPRIYAFEPSPRVYDLLQANCTAYGDPSRVRAFHCGVAEKKGRAEFTFYEHSSVFSSFHPDANEDRAAVQAVVRNVMEQELAGAGAVLDADVDALTTERLRAETIECPLTSVSDIIRENGLTRIHLLKIDAEKSELGILRGIAEEHWPLIEQIVMEVHDRTRSAVNAIEEQLTKRGFRCAVVEEKLLEDSGLFNIYATRRAPVKAIVDAEAGLQRKADEFCTALDTFAEFTSTPLILAIAPRPANSIRRSLLDAAEERVMARAERHPHVWTIGSPAILARYPVGHMHDRHSRQLGHMPFTPEGYATIGTTLSRAIFQIDAPPLKVIALDCDNTLWQGQCGEDGPAGIAVSSPYRHLQEFMIRQSQAGVLLALCSKNQEADVWTVFDMRTDMPLRREHLAGWQINWESKSANLRALAAQLNVGLDSFVFIDDNPIECATVRAGCPEVTVLQLPPDADRIPAFLENVWLFDRRIATREDRERSQWYRTNAERDELRSAVPTLQDFLDGLELRIEVGDATDEQLARVAQLTTRTNQFNFSSIRRTEGEIRDFLRSGARCLVTTVHDRFGDYGLVGAILYTQETNRYMVDTLLLSCRALGKGVEYHMVAELAARATREGKSTITLPYRPTDRNEPARAFLDQLGSGQTVSGSTAVTLELPAATLAGLRYTPDEQIAESSAMKAAMTEQRGGLHRQNLSPAMQRLGEELTTIPSIVAAIESRRRRAEPVAETDTETVAPLDGSSLEQSLASIWKKALGRTRIGFDENFFDAGGTSLKAVVVVAMIRKELKKNISIVSLFESPTIALLAARLDDSTGAGNAATEAAASAESRGRQRRVKLVKRRVA